MKREIEKTRSNKKRKSRENGIKGRGRKREIEKGGEGEIEKGSRRETEKGGERGE